MGARRLRAVAVVAAPDRRHARRPVRPQARVHRRRRRSSRSRRLLCGIAESGLELDLARAFQGIGGAAMFATALALIAQDFAGPRRGTAIACWGATVGGAVAVGPVLGGALTDGLGWRWIFFVNVPIGAAVLAIAVAANDEHRRRTNPSTSIWPGSSRSPARCFLFVLGLLRGNDKGWSSPAILGMLAGAVVLLAAFVVVELRQERPMFDLSLFRNRAFCGVSIATFAIGAGMFAALPVPDALPPESARLLAASGRACGSCPRRCSSSSSRSWPAVSRVACRPGCCSARACL